MDQKFFAQLEELISREIVILRSFLSNQRSEQTALLNKNNEQAEDFLDERLDLVAVFEKLREELITLVCQFAQQQKISRLEGELTHQRSIEILEEYVPVEEIELHALLGQLKAILVEIKNRNDLTQYFLSHKNISLHREIPQEALKKAPRKVMLELLDPPSE